MNNTYDLSAWSLADLFESADGPQMQAALKQLEGETTAFEQFRSQLSADLPGADFLEIIGKMENLTRLASRVGGFASLRFAGDTQDQAAQAFMARIDEFLAGLQNRVLFFEIWWKDLDDGNAQRLMAESGDYRYWLEQLRQFKPHTLTEVEEKIINIKNVTGANALAVLYDSITNRYAFKIQVDGEERELTRGELMVYARHHDADLRPGDA